MRISNWLSLLPAFALAGFFCVSGAKNAIAAQTSVSQIQAVETSQHGLAVPADYVYQGRHYPYRFGGKYYYYRSGGKYYNRRSWKNGHWWYY